MRRLALFGILSAAVAGCTATQSSGEEDAVKPRGSMLAMYTGAAVDNAIIRQHTIYPYHFVPGSADLNGLGRRDLGVLALHYASHPGQVNVAQGDASPELYERRVAAVLDALREAGIESGQLTFADGPAGGDGLSSRSVQILLEAITGEQPATYLDSGR